MTPFGTRLSELAARNPDGTALVFAAQNRTETVHSWGALEARANKIARLLAERGVGPGSWVAIGLINSPEHVQCTFAAWKLGATVLPFRWDLPEWERDRLLGLARPAVVISTSEFPAASPWAILTPADLGTSVEFDPDPLPPATADPGFAIASSGSTGNPKLIVNNSPAEIDLAAPVNPMIGASDSVVQLVTSPLYHTNGFGYHARVLAGGQVVLMERFDAAYAVDLVERYRINQVVLVPTMLSRIADLPGIEERDLSSLVNVFYGGAPLANSTARRWLELVGPNHFFFQYGGTEQLGAAMARGDEWLEHEGTVGRGLNCEIRILGEDGSPLLPGEVGDIYMRRTDAPPRFTYVGSPLPPRTEDGFSTFGDMGWLDEDGYLYISDRRTDMIVTGGANVYPAEVELALCEHPDVLDSVVVGLPDPEWGRRLHALVELRSAAGSLAPEVLSAHCRRMLAPYKVPKSFQVVERIPRTSAGKINRRALAEAAANDRTETAPT